MDNKDEKSYQDELDEEFEEWFWDKYNNEPDDLESWCLYWSEE